MVDTLIRRYGIRDERILKAMREIKRHEFVSPELYGMAYLDTAFPVGSGQTISQPYIVALTLVASDLNSDHTVLEIGTGTGYSAAITSRLVKEVYTIENVHALQ